MNKDFKKAIYTRSRLKKYNKNPTEEHKLKYKKQRNDDK